MSRLVIAAMILFFISCATSPRGADADRDGFPGEGVLGSGEEALPDSIVDGEKVTTPEVIVDEKPLTDTSDPLESIFSSPSALSALPTGYRVYSNSRFGYSLYIPANWYINEMVISRAGVTSVKRNSAAMKVKSYKPARKKASYYVNLAKRDIRKSDARYKTLVSEREIELHSGVFGKLMVHEYRHKRTRYIRRTLVFVQDGNAYIVSCEAPTSSFYSDETAFNTFMTSFRTSR